MSFYICVGSIILGIILGLSLARYNLNDSEGRAARLQARRAQRKNRK